MLSGLQGWEWIILLVIILLLFGAPKLPALAKSLGQSFKILKSEAKSDKQPKDEQSKDTEEPPATSSETTPKP
ncbi:MULTISPECIES: twin-arginine translocase TatA/TatE family subunit [unclassified Diaminobutyricimonas]|uniref:twin-arginine translocase TatA/TatE family subunit n=1 Tax=unclassified Diaminobutyricimonas TaxID=2643261 RepID=UPI0012F51A8E|nr:MULTISPECIES: twin-arginine translocase TatA/TatE family subunit [unclassified Diaminobutyricimonas]